MSAVPKQEMTADEFIAWSLLQPNDAEGGKLELVDGFVLRQQSERLVHIEVKYALKSALQAAITHAGRPCFAVGDGATVHISKQKVYKPDGLIYCGERQPPDTIEIASPVIIVEIVSPDSVGRDHGEKVEAYFALPSVHHYLIVDPERAAVVHHRRGLADELITRIRKAGALKLEPPGIEIEIAALFERR